MTWGKNSHICVELANDFKINIVQKDSRKPFVKINSEITISIL